MKEIELAARALGVQLQSFDLRGPDDLENAFSAMVKKRVGALILLVEPIFSNLRGQFAQLAVKSRLPAIYTQGDFVDAGGLMSYGPNFLDLYRRAATYVDKILQGAKPGDLPVEQPKKFEFIVNLKTAKELSLTIPPNVLARRTQLSDNSC
jgi:putative ABC transport system substrate-binding protein